MADIALFQEIFRLPDELLPYLDLVATDAEIDLVTRLGDRAMSLGGIAEMMRIGGWEAERLLTEAVHRAVINKQNTPDGVLYRSGNAYRRLTYLSMQDYETWRAIPAEVRAPILEWHLEENIRHHDLVRRLDLLQKDPDSESIHNRDILLLEEALALVDAAELHVVVPCDCRTTAINCDHPRWDTCLRLDDRGRWTLERGEGKIITKEACREIVLNANRSGLLHTGQRAENGRPAILNGNCCPCCSYPIRGGIALGMAKEWPKSHYVAQRDETLCAYCGHCVERCPFGALAYTGGTQMNLDQSLRMISFDADACFGCGLCATGCPQGAIKMEPLVAQ
jgi:ferredoxin